MLQMLQMIRVHAVPVDSRIQNQIKVGNPPKVRVQVLVWPMLVWPVLVWPVLVWPVLVWPVLVWQVLV